jgi:REP element-mobilizing transposase RayT
MSELRFFDRYAEIRQTANRLPHWQQQGCVYFLTFRLADSVPESLRRDWEAERAAWLNFHPEPWTEEIEREYHSRFSAAIERWLDAGHGLCLLRRGDAARIVADAFHYFDGDRFSVISFVVMPNHVHALLMQDEKWPLEKIVHSCKRYAARRINSLAGRSGSLWERDYFDRLVRNEKHFGNCIRYIRRNPRKARLGKDEYILYESAAALAVE